MKKIKPAIIELWVVILLLIVVGCSLFHFEPGVCLSVSLFGRFELRNIDRVVITSDGKEWTITDPDLIEQLCDETRVAEDINLCMRDSKTIDLYAGDSLVRSMKWGPCCDAVEVYKPGITHWLIGSLGIDSGCVYLSDKLLAQLNAIIQE